MSRSAVVALLLIAFPLASAYDAYRSRDGVVDFLRHYGYLDSTADRSLITNDELRQAISLFQEYYHLPVDGTLNNVTLRYMARPRCGVTNAPNHRLGIAPLRWPGLNLTWNFQLADRTTLRTTETAFALWAANSSLTFSRDTNKPDIIIAFREGRHTMLDRRYDGAVCPNDLDGPGKVLAHATLPSGAREDVSEVHVDHREAWHVALTPNPQNSYHLLRMLVHEIGHSLGLSHTTDENSLMYAYSPAVEWPVVLGMEDVLAVRNLYGVAEGESSTAAPAEPTVVQRTTTPASTTATAASPEPPDPCTWRHVDTLLVLGKRLFVTRGRYAWSIDLGGKIVDRPFVLGDYVRFLPQTVTRLSAAYQTVKGDLVLFADGWVYMVSYPTLELRASWPRRNTDLGLPPNAVINAALNAHKGRTYVIYNDYAVLEMDECNMTARGYHMLQTVFPGIPSAVRTAYRYTDGHLYFVHRDRFFAYNKFIETVTRSGKFDLDVIGVTCPREDILRKLWDLLTRLARSSIAFD
ncbi:Neutrophil collagenase [Ooceraea biroi]|uniref:Neutrophil collagenase n=1 Tax=Ooceraea biroi TaxID=2015173 RepID=A0A026WKF0_OOCBI|nr:Neutrophil collagenase [Ooceraea biroi]